MVRVWGESLTICLLNLPFPPLFTYDHYGNILISNELLNWAETTYQYANYLIINILPSGFRLLRRQILNVIGLRIWWLFRKGIWGPIWKNICSHRPIALPLAEVFFQAWVTWNMTSTKFIFRNRQIKVHIRNLWVKI